MLTTTVSYQILQPLQSNIDGAHLLMQSRNLPPELRKIALRLLISSKMVVFFANDLLDNNALEGSHFVPILKYTSVSGIFQEVIFIVSESASEKNLKIQADLEHIRGCKMKIDTQRL